jgi:protocatechuate 3,4-dioxygenase, alpha subunit
LQATASQTVGPFFHIGMTPLMVSDLASGAAKGERYLLGGTVVDSDRQPVNDALLEIWQANALGKYAHPDDTQSKAVDPAFKGFGRIATDDNGAFRVMTIKPGRVPGPDGHLQAPHLAVAIFMRGLLRHLVTRIYFPDEPSNTQDAILQLVPQERRGTLIARRVAAREPTLEWNVVLQGKEETVFFDY